MEWRVCESTDRCLACVTRANCFSIYITIIGKTSMDGSMESRRSALNKSFFNLTFLLRNWCFCSSRNEMKPHCESICKSFTHSHCCIIRHPHSISNSASSLQIYNVFNFRYSCPKLFHIISASDWNIHRSLHWRREEPSQAMLKRAQVSIQDHPSKTTAASRHSMHNYYIYLVGIFFVFFFTFVSCFCCCLNERENWKCG